MDTDYGKNFQEFLLKHTFVHSVIDSEFKYFNSKDGPNINTVITIFFGNKPSKSNNIFFIKYPGLVANSVDKNYHNNFENPPIIKTYSYNDEILNSYKWGILLKSENILLELLQKLSKI